jgi:hypothetical protein
VFGIITTIIEIVGAALIAVGIGVLFGVGAACIAAGALMLVGSYLATSGVTEGAIE